MPWKSIIPLQPCIGVFNMDDTLKQEITELVKDTMQTQQSAFLKSAAINAVDIVDQRISQNNSELKARHHW